MLVLFLIQIHIVQHLSSSMIKVIREGHDFISSGSFSLKVGQRMRKKKLPHKTCLVRIYEYMGSFLIIIPVIIV